MIEMLGKRQAERIQHRLERLYGREEAVKGLRRFRMMLGRYEIGSHEDGAGPLWNETDSVLITYADSIREDKKAPLATLHGFLRDRLGGSIRTVHLLPFYPWTSDDGFSVVDYREVAEENGEWRDVEALGRDYSLMFDLVLNHCSRRSQWFRDFVTGVRPGANYFLTEDPKTDLSAVVRPRSSPLLTKTATRDGDAWVWTTFSADQVDLNWQDPNVLFEFIDILFWYVSKGMRIVRLDAVAFLWKELGTDCLHRPETHEVVKLLRDVLAVVAPHVIVLTETNVPHEENMSYFGSSDEAHMIYNFSLPPLLLHALLRGDSTHLTAWARSLPELPAGQAFLNFTASHDGIGVRPLQGILTESELSWLVSQVQARDGRVSMRAMPDGSETPYELNISYRSALSVKGDRQASIDRFLCSQAVMLAMRGMPAVYIHSLLGSENDLEGLEASGQNRRINRKKWDLTELLQKLDEKDSEMGFIFNRYRDWLERRKSHPAFHPGAPMEVLELGSSLFGLTRTSLDGREKVICVFNLSEEEQKVRFAALDACLEENGSCRDILSGEMVTTGIGKGLTLPPYHARWLEAEGDITL